MEKVHKVMKCSGAWNIVIGVLLIVTGVGFGIISIINGGRLIKAKKDVLF